MQVTMSADDFLQYIVRNSIHSFYVSSGPFSLPVDKRSLVEQLTGGQAACVVIEFCTIARRTVLFSASLDSSGKLAVSE